MRVCKCCPRRDSTGIYATLLSHALAHVRSAGDYDQAKTRATLESLVATDDVVMFSGTYMGVSGVGVLRALACACAGA